MNQAEDMCRLRSGGGQEIIALVELQVLTDPNITYVLHRHLSAVSVPFTPLHPDNSAASSQRVREASILNRVRCVAVPACYSLLMDPEVEDLLTRAALARRAAHAECIRAQEVIRESHALLDHLRARGELEKPQVPRITE